MDTCPACGSHRVFRSRTRTRFERLRRELTSKRPYRCHACDWRGWGRDGMLVAADGEVADAPLHAPDLHAIDSALSNAPKEPREELRPASLSDDARSVKPKPKRRKRVSR